MSKAINDLVALAASLTPSGEIGNGMVAQGTRKVKQMTELEKAEQDAKRFGVGYVVNGKRVDPVEVVIVQRAATAREPTPLDAIIEHGRRCAMGEGW